MRKNLKYILIITEITRLSSVWLERRTVVGMHPGGCKTPLSRDPQVPGSNPGAGTAIFIYFAMFASHGDFMDEEYFANLESRLQELEARVDGLERSVNDLKKYLEQLYSYLSGLAQR